MKDPAKGTVYIVAEARLAALPGAVPKQKKDKKKAAAAADGAADPAGFAVLATFKGADLVRKRMECFPASNSAVL